MTSSLTNPPSSHKSNLYEKNLTKSLQTLIAETRKPNANFSQFLDKFHEFTQSKLDPPLGSIWVYAALTYKSQTSTNSNLKDRISAVKDLFVFIASCSASFSALKSVALIAPVVFEAYKVIVECTKEAGLKRERKAVREIKALVDAIVGYVGLCCEGVNEGSDSDLGLGIDDLVQVWAGSDGGVESFFPLLGGEVCGVVGLVGWNLRYFVGVVVVEVFLLKLCLRVRDGGERVELEKELKGWAVGSINAFKNSYFFEILLRMLLEPNLPVSFLLGLEDESLLRKILLDAIVLVDYSFLNPDTAANPPVNNMKNLAIASLIVTHDAVESFRKQGDRAKAFSYLTAFSNSCLPSELIKLVTSQIGLVEKAGEAFKSSPKNLLRWLLKLNAQGIRVFDDTISSSRAKLNLNISKEDEYSMSKAMMGTDDSDLFYFDKKGEEDDMASDEAAAHLIRSNEKGSRKRKEKKSAELKKQIKFSKYGLTDHTGTRRVEDMNSDSEIDNLSSDEDTEAEKH